MYAFGDLVVVKGTPGVAIVAELRKGDCRAQYLLEGRSVWAELRDLRPARDEETAGTIGATVRDLLRELGAREMELTLPSPGRCRLSVSHGAIEPETVDRVRALLSDRLVRFHLRPQGMHRIQSILEFTLIDPAAVPG